MAIFGYDLDHGFGIKDSPLTRNEPIALQQFTEVSLCKSRRHEIGAEMNSLIAQLMNWFPDDPAEFWKSLGILSAIITSIATGVIFMLKQWAAYRRKNPDFVSVEYARLFGGSEVPLLLKFLGREWTVKDSSPSWGPFDLLESNGELTPAHKDFVRFLSTFPLTPTFKASRPLWAKYEGNKRLGQKLSFLAVGPDIDELNKWIVENDIDESGQMCEHFEVGDQYADKNGTTFERKVGFVFLIVRNTSNIDLVDVTVEFEKYEHFAIDLALDDFEIKDDGEKSYYEQLLQVFQAKGAPGDYLRKMHQESECTEEYRIDRLGVDQSCMFLMGVYVCDEYGLEQYLLDDYYSPKRVKYTRGRDRRSIYIRKPYGKRAARLTVPYGWFSQ